MLVGLAPRRTLLLAVLIALPLGQLLIGDVVSTATTSTPAATQPRATTYTYDGAGRLVQTDYGDAHATYTYDEAGNLLRLDVAGSGRGTPVPTETPSPAAPSGGGCALRG